MRIPPLSARQQLDGAVPVTIAGEPRVLRLTLEAMAEYQHLAPTSRLEGAMVALWAMLLHDGRGTTFEDLGEALDGGDVQALMPAVQRCMDLCSAPPSGEKSHNKPMDWMHLWSYAEIDLRISEDRFWMLTPRQFSALSDRHEEAYLRSLHGAAVVSTTLANIHRDSKKHEQAFTPQELFPALFKLAEQREPERVKRLEAAQDLRAQSRRIFAQMGGRTVKVQAKKPKFLNG